jgi:hypothetical protein
MFILYEEMKISQLVQLQYHIRYAEFAVGDKVL